MTCYVAYYRVSTERQGKSGLGLAAQRRKIAEFISAGHELVGEFCDVQSGKDDTRQELQKASLYQSGKERRSSLPALIASPAELASSPAFLNRASA
jgi:hypothetical protein